MWLLCEKHDIVVIQEHWLLPFELEVLYLETTIDTVSTWMSAHLLSLNQSKTEFLLIGLPKQLAKVSDPNLRMPSNNNLYSP